MAEAVFKDFGRAKELTYLYELDPIKAECQWDIDHLNELCGDKIVETELMLGPGTTLIRYEPFGVVGIFGAWNYPYQLTLKPMVQAITCGNAVLMKPSEISPCSSAVMKKFVDKYLDTSTIQVCEGGIDVAVAFNNLKLDYICFTGSTFVGKIVAETAAKNMIPCIMELGGKCPAIIDTGVDMETALVKVTTGKFSNSGQTCVAPDYVLCHQSKLKEFTEGVK